MKHMKKCVHCRANDAVCWTGWVLQGGTKVLAGWCRRCAKRLENGPLSGFTGHISPRAATLTGRQVNRMAPSAAKGARTT